MRIGALVLALVFVLPPQGADTNLGDWGLITYPDTPPNIARIEHTIIFVFSLFPDVDIPPTRIKILPLAEYEEQLAQLEAGPMWRQWLSNFRSQKQFTVQASTNKRAASEGRLEIMTAGELPDMVLIHEVLHYCMARLEPGSWASNDTEILNTEQNVQRMTASIMVSRRYRAYQRARPWVR